MPRPTLNKRNITLSTLEHWNSCPGAPPAFLPSMVRSRSMGPHRNHHPIRGTILTQGGIEIYPGAPAHLDYLLMEVLLKKKKKRIVNPTVARAAAFKSWVTRRRNAQREQEHRIMPAQEQTMPPKEVSFPIEAGTVRYLIEQEESTLCLRYLEVSSGTGISMPKWAWEAFRKQLGIPEQENAPAAAPPKPPGEFVDRPGAIRYKNLEAIFALIRKSGKLGKATLAVYISRLRYFGHHFAGDLAGRTPEDIAEFMSLIPSGANRRNYIHAIRFFYAFAHERGLLQGNPAKNISISSTGKVRFEG